MRYFEFSIKTNSEEIKNTEKVRLKEYDYDRPVAGLNGYLYSNLDNHVNFLAYREEKNNLLCIFSYDEREISYERAFLHLTQMLDSAFDFKGLSDEPYEITMYEYTDNLIECKRRQLLSRGGTCHADNAHLWLYQYIYNSDKQMLPYIFKERIISEKNDKMPAIYDPSFKKELINIENHAFCENINGVMAHYFISTNDFRTTEEMIDTLGAKLFKAGRISSKRIEIVTDLAINLSNRDNHLEDMLDNNYGGMIVFSLREKLGTNPTQYYLVCKYLCRIFNQYKSKCVFVFAYEKENPGFSYNLLQEIGKSAICVNLKEGKGSRKQAVDYMHMLISKSENADYADCAREFMKLYEGNIFTQSDVIRAYERFDSWCLNKRMNGAYDVDMSEAFMLDRDEDKTSPYERLQKLTGLNTVKKQIDCILASYVVETIREKQRENHYQAGSRHMIFAGNPGTAKTTVAKLFAGIAKEKGILKSGVFVERGGMDFNGFAAVMAVRDAFAAAKGGVLFIDEAYSMENRFAIAALIQEMENHRDDVIVIFAGYTESMEAFLELNDGLKSRIPHRIDFPDYSAEELTEIFKQMISERHFIADEAAISEAAYIFKKAKCIDNFGNGRYVRNLLDQAIMNQSSRLLPKGKTAGDIKKSDLFRLKKEDITMMDDGTADGQQEDKEEKSESAVEELNHMIGLKPAKEIIRKAIANARLNKLCLDKGIRRDSTSMHMVFTGNPGTAKTTVARLFAEIMRDEKILDAGRFVEVGRAELIGDHVGETAPLVKKRFKEARGGVLFIDEAYSLCDDSQSSFGDEAINTIVQEMENHRDDTVVIFAGYPEPMKKFLAKNPGMRSRIAFQVSFDDYSSDELCDITKRMLSKKNLCITEAAMRKMEAIYNKACKNSDFGNGRFVRNILEEAQMNLAERLMSVSEDEITEDMITTLNEHDIPNSDSLKHLVYEKHTNPIGFSTLS